MKKYSAIFFDWDGTAVLSRKASADRACAAMKPLLSAGVPLIIISGTTYENIAGGEIERFFTKEELKNLYLGLGRGAFQYAYTEAGKPCLFRTTLPTREQLMQVHQICFDIHKFLLERYDFATDIVFTRPNYCKIDLMPEHDRGDQLFMQDGEQAALANKMQMHGITDGMRTLTELAERLGKAQGLKIVSTSDSKYLEVGLSSKSDNVNVLLSYLLEQGIQPQDCAFFGDEYVRIESGDFGSDAFMMTPLSAEADFFDVSNITGERPPHVTVLGGGVDTFLNFLHAQAQA